MLILLYLEIIKIKQNTLRISLICAIFWNRIKKRGFLFKKKKNFKKSKSYFKQKRSTHILKV